VAETYNCKCGKKMIRTGFEAQHERSRRHKVWATGGNPGAVRRKRKADLPKRFLTKGEITPELPEPISFCPRCGEDLRPHNMAKKAQHLVRDL
jgi:hypothetical protein